MDEDRSSLTREGECPICFEKVESGFQIKMRCCYTLICSDCFFVFNDGKTKYKCTFCNSEIMPFIKMKRDLDLFNNGEISFHQLFTKYKSALSNEIIDKISRSRIFKKKDNLLVYYAKNKDKLEVKYQKYIQNLIQKHTRNGINWKMEVEIRGVKYPLIMGIIKYRIIKNILKVKNFTEISSEGNTIQRYLSMNYSGKYNKPLYYKVLKHVYDNSPKEYFDDIFILNTFIQNKYFEGLKLIFDDISWKTWEYYLNFHKLKNRYFNDYYKVELSKIKKDNLLNLLECPELFKKLKNGIQTRKLINSLNREKMFELICSRPEMMDKYSDIEHNYINVDNLKFKGKNFTSNTINRYQNFMENLLSVISDNQNKYKNFKETFNNYFIHFRRRRELYNFLTEQKFLKLIHAINCIYDNYNDFNGFLELILGKNQFDIRNIQFLILYIYEMGKYWKYEICQLKIVNKFGLFCPDPKISFTSLLNEFDKDFILKLL